MTIFPGKRKSGGEKRKASPPVPDDWGMVEKYLHSYGAFLFEQGRLDEAIESFHQALSIEETAYSHCDLGRAYLAKGEFDAALREMSLAIELAKLPDYYYEKSLMWRRMGNPDRASLDYGRAIEIDPNYRHIEEIRSAQRVIESTLTGLEQAEESSATEVKNPELRTIIAGLKDDSEKNIMVLEGSSCPIAACPAYCCHFSGSLVRHGVSIGAWKLDCVRNFLKERGLRAEDFLERMPFNGEEHLRSLVPPHHVINEKAGDFVYFPMRGKNPIDEPLLKDLPKGKDFHTLAWINEKARPCAFLSEKRCMVHDIGDEESLESCKQFLCLTGFVFVILTHMELIDPAMLTGKTMTDLNGIAVKALLILSRTIFSEHIITSRRTMIESLNAAILAEKKGETGETAAMLREYTAQAQRHEEMKAGARSHAIKEIGGILQCP